MKILARTALGATTFLLATVGVTTNTSADMTGSHGSVCTARPGDKDKVDFSSARGAYNKSTSSSAQIYCSVDVDGTSSWLQNARRLDITYIDNSSSGDIDCTLYLQDYQGTTVQSARLVSSGAVNGVRVMTWAAYPPLSNIQYWWGHLSCKLPAWSGSGPEPQIRGFNWSTDL
jgi:hypothetical protein